MAIDFHEVDLLADVIRRICKLERKSIQQLKKIEGKLHPKCENLPLDRTIDVVEKYREELAAPYEPSNKTALLKPNREVMLQTTEQFKKLPEHNWQIGAP